MRSRRVLKGQELALVVTVDSDLPHMIDQLVKAVGDLCKRTRACRARCMNHAYEGFSARAVLEIAAHLLLRKSIECRGQMGTAWRKLGRSIESVRCAQCGGLQL